jgi:hypothetical protein
MGTADDDNGSRPVWMGGCRSEGDRHATTRPGKCYRCVGPDSRLQERDRRVCVWSSLLSGTAPRGVSLGSAIRDDHAADAGFAKACGDRRPSLGGDGAAHREEQHAWRPGAGVVETRTEHRPIRSRDGHPLDWCRCLEQQRGQNQEPHARNLAERDVCLDLDGTGNRWKLITAWTAGTNESEMCRVAVSSQRSAEMLFEASAESRELIAGSFMEFRPDSSESGLVIHHICRIF